MFDRGALGAIAGRVLRSRERMRAQRPAMIEQQYVYRGDRLTMGWLRGRRCEAVRRVDGKCIRGKNGNMLVTFTSGEMVVVLGRQLRKV